MSNSQPRDYQELYRILVEDLTEYAIFLMDLSGTVTTWNHGVERILGYREEEFVGRSISMVFTPDDIARGEPEREREHAIRCGRSADVRWHLRKDRSRFFVDGVVTAIKNSAGEVVALSKVMRDVTERKRAEDERKAHQERLRHILESINDAFYAVDAEFRFTYVNRRAEELWNRRRDDLVGRELWKEFPTAVGSESYRNHVRAMQERTTVRFEVLSPVLGRWINVSIYPETSGGLSCYFQDTSSRKHAEAQRDELLARLSRSNEDLTQFAYVVSHDLQTPLRTVRSYARLLEREAQDHLSTNGREYLEFILDGAQRMEGLIAGLLNYAQAAESDSQKTPVSMDEVIAGVIASMHATVQEAGATVTYDPLPVVSADPVQLAQLLQNLIGNALKYRLRDTAAWVRISAAESPSEWIFSVRDNGLGIEAKHIDRIFLPLNRLHGAEIPGTGMGLAICKKIVERNRGRIWVESDPGKGSTFYFTLPR
jgi:PAS domain S-box-containing protein